jgi:hypothetical protein
METRGRFFMSRESTTHLADLVLERDRWIRDEVLQAIDADLPVDLKTRTERSGRRPGINPRGFDASVRDTLLGQGWRTEAAVVDGVIFDSPTRGSRVEGFDLARYDQEANFARFWSLCHGRRRLFEGARLYEQELAKRSDWRTIAGSLRARAVPGEDLVLTERVPTILGEIQTGNWGLIYRDWFKLLQAKTQRPVDLFIYLVPDGNYAAHLSSGIVTYARALEFVRVEAADITIPTWVVGVDLEVTYPRAI